jgi:hypothetical protein
MEAGEPVQAIDSEVDQVRWLPLEAAVDALSYPLERDFLRSSVQSGVPVGWLGSIPLRHRFFDTSTARLRKANAGLQIDLRRAIGKAGAEQNWAFDAMLLIDRVRRAIEERDSGFGWQCHKHADRLRLHGLSEHELRLAAQRIVNETEKLSPWRSNTVKQFLLEDGHLKSTISAIEVTEAAKLVHENEENTYRRLRLRSLQFASLGISALVFLICYVALVRFSGGANSDLGTWSGISQISLLGALGAAVSGILRIGGDETARRIPIELSAFGFLIARVMVGAAAALALVALWQSGFIKSEIITNGQKFAMALAFAASRVA